ncbi:MAG: NAD(P)-binding domain-containing protein [Clostridia bacterium]|nr:NAD(P)-binding domain-containing protein [Clostridia bacterium]
MRYAVIGGDMRFAHLASMLNEAGRPATGFLQERANDESAPLSELKKHSIIITNWPMRWPLSGQQVSEEEIMDQIEPGSVLLLCGPKFQKDKRWDLQYVNLWEDEKLLRENAWLTAEAVAASAMRRTGRSLMHMECAVIGYGRIGRALTEILKNLGARVTVISRTEAKRRLAEESGAQSADMIEIGETLPGKQLIFSTPPSAVIDVDLLRKIDKNALIMDLASPPYGFDLDAAQDLGLNACREPGLPGRYCPLSAARVIYHAVLRWEEAERDG